MSYIDYSNPSCYVNSTFGLNLNSYTNQSNEPSMMATSCIMFILAIVFFILNLFSRTSDVSAILNPSIRLFLSTSLSLFLPVMSYLFSEAKNEAAAAQQHDKDTSTTQEFPLRARTILMWLLLVEVLRNKVEAIVLISPAGGARGSYSIIIERAGRIAWLGYLVFYNLRGAALRAMYGSLWVVAASKLVQRFLTVELGKRSFAYGKNPQLIDSYMAQQDQQQQQQQQQQRGWKLLKLCNYVVMGEEELEKKLALAPNGYNLERRLTESIEEEKQPTVVVTVGKICELAIAGESSSSSSLLGKKWDPRVKRLCLSFALYKLLRRRLEDFPITKQEASYCHSIIFRGLCCCECEDDEEEEAGDKQQQQAAIALFDVFNDEVRFLCEYYHSVFPVMLASTFFFAVYYILFPIVVLALCCLTIVLCSDNNVLYGAAFRYLAIVTVDTMRDVIVCIGWKLTKAPQYLFFTIDLCITILLIITFVYEEIWEFLVFLLSKWFVVSLLCSYASRPVWRSSRLLGGLIRRMLWVRSVLIKPKIRFKQFSVMWLRYRFCLHPRFLFFLSAVRTKAVPTQVKKAIMQRLADTAGGVVPLSIISGRSPAELRSPGGEFAWACDGSVAEIILIWHIATAMLETTTKKPAAGAADDDNRAVATALSKYCAYLVAFRPELLPDDRDWTERVYEEMEEELKKEMGRKGYYLSRPGARCGELVEIARRRSTTEAATTTAAMAAAAALRKGAKLGDTLCGKPDAEAGHVWRLLADLWTEVVVYAAAASSEQHIKAHREALAQGGEFITVIWAITTHTGIARGPVVDQAQSIAVEHSWC